MSSLETLRKPRRAKAVDQVDELRALYQLTDRLYRARSPDDVYAAALDAICDTLRCDRASILLFDDAGVMQFAAWRGLSERYRQAVAGHSPWTRGSRDPEPIFVPDIRASNEADWIKDTVAAEGIRGLGFIPLVAQGEVVGKFMTYHEAPRFFDERETALSVTIARHLGFSLERARTERMRQAAVEELRESEERFRLMSEHAPVMIWMSGPTGGCLHLNRMLRAFWDVDEREVGCFDWRPNIHPEDEPGISAKMGAAIAARSGVSVSGRYRNAAGEYRVLETDARPRFSVTGEFLGLIGVNVDVTERHRSEQALRESEERFRLAVEAAPSGMVMIDATGAITLVNANAARLFGYEPEELEGLSIERLVPERFRHGHPGFRDAYADAPSAREMGGGRDLHALRKDGSEVPVEIGISPIMTPRGRMSIAAVVDISARKRADAQRELLLAELNHRVKNSLAVVQAIANQTFKGAGADRACRAFQGRLAALAIAQTLLTQGKWETASLERLCADTLCMAGLTGERVSIAGPGVLLSPKQALAITLALHELITNAVKHGALSNDDGRVDLSWRLSDEARLKLVWREHGGPAVPKPNAFGFGTFLIEQALANDLNGVVVTDYREEGLVCTIEAPLRVEGGPAA